MRQVLVWLLLLAMPLWAAEEAEDAPEKESEPKALTATQEAAWFAFTQQVTEAWMKQQGPQLQGTLQKFVESNQLTKEQQEKVTEIFPATLVAYQAAWQKGCGEWLREYAGNGEEYFKEWQPGQTAQSAATYYVSVSILGLPAWTEGLQRVLPAEKVAELTAASKERREKLLATMKDTLAMRDDQVKENFTQSMEPKVKQMAQFISHDAERVKALRKAAEAAANASTVRWREKFDAKVQVMSEADLKLLKQRIEKNNVFDAEVNKPALQPQRQPVWKEGLATLFTPEERKQMAAQRLQTRTRRAAALAGVLLEEMDVLIGFSAAQYPQVLAAMTPQMLKLSDDYFAPRDPNNGYSSISPRNLFPQVKEMDLKSLEGVLSGPQLEHWKALKPEMIPQGENYSNRWKPKLDAGAAPPQDAVELEQFLSALFLEDSQVARKVAQQQMDAQVEAVSRLTTLTPAQLAHLTTAAKGCALGLAQNQARNLESQVRQQTANLAAAEVPQRLASLNLYDYQQTADANELPIWSAALTQCLDPATQAAWAAEQRARARRAENTKVAIILTEVEKQLPLQPEQIKKLAAKVTTVLKDYEPDIRSCISGNWHLQGYYCTLPIALLSAKELSAIFDQTELVILKQECLGEAESYADSVRKQHRQRTQKPTPKKP